MCQETDHLSKGKAIQKALTLGMRLTILVIMY